MELTEPPSLHCYSWNERTIEVASYIRIIFFIRINREHLNYRILRTRVMLLVSDF